MREEDLPDGWTRWHAGADGTLVLAFRPDVFDAQEFPAPCLPTISVKRARVRGPRGRPTVRPGGERDWEVHLWLEPDVPVERASRGTREEAVATALELARAFVAGEVAYREAYAEPRVAYLDALDAILEGDGQAGREV